MVLWGGVAAALAVLVVGIVFFTGGDDKQDDASVQTLPSVTLSTPSSDVPVETVAATTVAPPTAAPTTLAPTTLAPTVLLPVTLAPQVTAAPGPATPPVIGEAASLRPGIPYTEYVSITDESNLIEMSVPVEWSDIDARLWAEPDLATGQVDNLIGPFLAASPNLDAMVETWGTPGVFLGASPSIYWTLDELLDLFDQSESCTLVGRFDYDDGLYTGLFDNYTNCGAEGSDLMIAFVRPADLSWTAMLQITVVTEADREAASTVVETFMIQPLGG